jgi:chemotaxis protein methyltransferase CheR
MTDGEFAYICQFLRERSALVLEPGKEYLVESRLSPLVEELGLSSIGDLIARLRSQPPDGLHTRVVEAMVTTETTFFRDRAPFETLRKTIIPELMRLRSVERVLNIWCAASASGQEPYSLAMLLREHFPELCGWKVTLLASDISREMLARARQGRYNQIEVNRGLPATLLVKYFQQEGDLWQLRGDLRAAVEFREINLAKPWPALPRMDLVLLRNVMIYFDVETKKGILGKLARVLRPDGYLLLGGAETTFTIDPSYRRLEHLKAGFYQVGS